MEIDKLMSHLNLLFLLCFIPFLLFDLLAAAFYPLRPEKFLAKNINLRRVRKL